jgi:hypothetical protein
MFYFILNFAADFNLFRNFSKKKVAKIKEKNIDWYGFIVLEKNNLT